MTITNKDYDTWESKMYGLPYAVYSYYIDSTVAGENTAVIGASGDNVFSVVYTPFLDISDLELEEIPYDNKRFGNISEIRPEIKANPHVFRIKKLLKGSKFVGEFETYKVKKSVGGKRNWRNESKLYNYPYTYLMLSDGINNPMILKPQFCSIPNCSVGIKLSVSDRCSYGIFVQTYKGDTDGMTESLVSNDALELPCTSSAYANWVATSKNQTAQSIQNTVNQTILNDKIAKNNMSLGIANSVVGGVASAFTGNVGGVIDSVFGGVGSYMDKKHTNMQSQLTRESAISSALATANDMRSTPNTLLSQGSNIIYGLRNGGQELRLYRYGLTERYYEKIGDYFAQFGYKQNKMMEININSRYYYNYIKTIGINIKTNKIPNNYLNILKGIFDNGTTIWHIDNDGVEIGNYSMDNREV